MRRVQRRHDAAAPAQVRLVDVGRLGRERPGLLSEHVALDNSTVREEREEEEEEGE